MKKIVFVFAFCTVVSLGTGPAVQAGDGVFLTPPIVVAEEKGKVKECIKWVQKKVKVWVKDHFEVRTRNLCAVAKRS